MIIISININVLYLYTMHIYHKSQINTERKKKFQNILLCFNMFVYTHVEFYISQPQFSVSLVRLVNCCQFAFFWFIHEKIIIILLPIYNDQQKHLVPTSVISAYFQQFGIHQTLHTNVFSNVLSSVWKFQSHSWT